MARYNLYKNGDFVNSIEAELMFTMAFCQSQGLTYEEVIIPTEPKLELTQLDRIASLETETETLKTQVQTLTNSDKINSGTYTGTGLYGESNPNSVRPNIPAKVLMIIQNNETILTLSRTESTDEPFVWFASSAKEQCNENGLDYNWIAVS